MSSLKLANLTLLGVIDGREVPRDLTSTSTELDKYPTDGSRGHQLSLNHQNYNQAEEDRKFETSVFSASDIRSFLTNSED